AAELLNQKADSMGFDAISMGGVLSWLMDCLDRGLIEPQELGVSQKPCFNPEGFDIVNDSMHNAVLGMALIDEMVKPDGLINLKEGARKYARQIARKKGKEVIDCFLYVSFARHGWMVPNQYWTPGALSPMAIMGKYYMNYGKVFIPPRELGRENAKRMIAELSLDNLGMCRFHRAWAEDMIPEIIDKLFGNKDKFLDTLKLTASRINSRNASIFWESALNIDFVYSFLKKQKDEGNNHPELEHWLNRFDSDKHNAALDFWYDIHKGIHESLSEFPV
ncbi:MAG: aldehyde ferredoxin oxidoreductase, partial [Bacteroidales bacterium]|nr:aldehyde ferredoxin oxidoreductase [Bacteroidales bacterium]